jgi:hypothetical protein
MAMVLIVSLISGCGPNESDIVDVQFFHDEICPACETYKTAINIGNALLSLAKKHKDIRVELHNMVDPATHSKLREQLEERGLPDVTNSIPIILIDNTYYTGYENILVAVDELKKR